MIRALLERCLTKWLEDADPAECVDLVEAIRTHLAQPQGEPESFDVWRENPYTIARVKSVEEDYHPAHTEAEAIELDRLAAFIHTASCPEEAAMAMAEHGEAVRRILGVKP